MKKLLENFRSPGAEFRGMPFWAWNAKLDKDELIRQIHTFKAMGLGGFFMHARVGLNTPYLGKEWFDCVKVCVSEAKKLLSSGVISGGMIPKVDSGVDSLKNGVRRVHFVDGYMPHSLLLEIFTDQGIGTEIVAD